jgi:hypothetical protein
MQIWHKFPAGIYSCFGKKSVYKLLKESPDEFKDLCKLGDSDVETAVDASRKLVSNLHDQRGK